MRLFDSHTHLQFSQFDLDREAVISRARAAGVIGMINVGTDLTTSQQALALAEAHDDMWATVGLHPTDTDQEFNKTEFTKLAQHPKVVAIGECGLDYFRTAETKDQQKEIFNQQIELARLVNKPLMIHCRNAYDDLLVVVKNFPGVRGNLHFFAGDWLIAKEFLDLGFTLSLAGPITFTNQYDEVIINTPLEGLLVETDAPFAAPAPYRGRRNEPSYVAEMARRVAQLKGLTVETVAEATIKTASRLFSLPIA